MQASRREADARLEADMLTADISELSLKLHQANSSLLHERQRNELLKEAIAVRICITAHIAAARSQVSVRQGGMWQ